MRSRPPRPHWIEVFVVVMIIAALVSSCTVTRGPCTFVKEIKTSFVCQDDGRVLHFHTFTP